MQNRIFTGIFPGGIVYADRDVEEHGDFKKLAFLPYDTLQLDIKADCPGELISEIVRSAAAVQAKRGEEFRISETGQSIVLGKSLQHA
jgi:hypothetical protein